MPSYSVHMSTYVICHHQERNLVGFFWTRCLPFAQNEVGCSSHLWLMRQGLLSEGSMGKLSGLPQSTIHSLVFHSYLDHWRNKTELWTQVTIGLIGKCSVVPEVKMIIYIGFCNIDFIGCCLSSGCPHKVLQSKWLTNHRKLFPMVPEAGCLRSGYQHGCVLVRTVFLVANCLPLTSSHSRAGLESSPGTF